jgi:hypothetical protein
MNILRWFKRFACEHAWEVYKFQALNNLPGEVDIKCTKCGKMDKARKNARRKNR